jgi:hypothetical protein
MQGWDCHHSSFHMYRGWPIHNAELLSKLDITHNQMKQQGVVLAPKKYGW